MKKRKGFILSEILISISVMTIILTLTLPLWANISKSVYNTSQNLSEQSIRIFTQDFINDHLRNTKERIQRTEDGYEKNITYYNYNEYEVIAPYKMRIYNSMWYLTLYNGKKQPLTEADLRIKATDNKPFYIHKHGLVNINYNCEDAGGKQITVQTAIISLADYFKKGEVYE